MADETDLNENAGGDTPAETAQAAPAAAAIPGAGMHDIDVEEEMSHSYIDYSMSVIIGRALPDVRDGLKPVHRRVLFGMNELNNTFSNKHKKSARVVGDVMGKYHPHGDASIYDTIVRMAQPFAMRAPLVDGHGNFGSIDGDGAAASRYTEVRLQRIAEELLDDLDKDTVDMEPNYDGTCLEPSVLPARLPNLLLNGSSGIAVGMATNIPPHNLGELCDGITHYIDNPGCSIADLMQFVKGPDFPTGASVCGVGGIHAMYTTGRGQLVVRGKAKIEEGGKSRRDKIIITEIPYTVNKADMIAHMVELVKDKAIEGISDIRDLSKDDIRIEIDLKQDAIAQVVLNNLYKHTQLQTTFGAIMLAIDQGRPRLLTLKDFFRCHVNHRFEVITRRTRFELKKAEARRHILEGLLLALANLDDVVAIIRSSANRDEAKERLVAKYAFSAAQVGAILDMRLYQLTGLERGKLEEEMKALLERIAEYEAILADPAKIHALIKQDLAALKEKYASRPDFARRTEIAADENDVTVKDLIPDEPCVITLSHRGYAKRVKLTEYRQQRRGGTGVTGLNVKEEDFIRLVFVAQTHDSLLFFTDTGRVFIRDAFQIPEASRQSFGRPLVNILNLRENERVVRLLPLRSFDGDVDVMFATKCGTVKKTLLGDYRNINRNGIIAINLDEGDSIVDVRLVTPSSEIVLVTAGGRGIRFAASDVRRMGRGATGVRGIRLLGSDRVVAFDTVDDGKTFLLATENGYTKRIEFKDFTAHHRGGQGLIAIKGEDRNGLVVAARTVADDESVISITSDGMMVRSPVRQISVVGRAAQGVRLLRLGDDAKLVSLSVADGAEEEDVEATDSPVTAENPETAETPQTPESPENPEAPENPAT